MTEDTNETLDQILRKLKDLERKLDELDRKITNIGVRV
jgi:hypothetical protein